MSHDMEHPRALAVLLILAALTISTPAHAQNAPALEKKKLGDALAAKGDHAGAEAAYRGAITADSSYRAAYTALSTNYLRRQKYGEAVSLLRRAVKRDKAYSEGWYNLAYALRKSGKMGAAIEAYRAFAKLDPASADPYFGLGLAYKSLGKYADAATAFRRYTELEKRPDRKSWIEKASRMSREMARKAGDTPAAAPAGPAMATKEVPTSQRLREEGDRLYQQGRVTEAVAKFNAAIKADPKDTAALDALASSLFRLRRYSEAVKVFRRATRADPAYTQGWYNLAYAQRKLGRHALAVKAYNRYIKLNPNNSDPYFGVALAYKGLGKKKAAVKAFKQYIQREKRPGQEKWIHKARVEIARLQGKPEPAVDGAPTIASLPPVDSADKGTAKEGGETAAEEAARKQRERDMAMMLAANRYTEKKAKGKRSRRGRKGRSKGKKVSRLPLVTPAEDRPIAPPAPDEPTGEEAGESGKLRDQGNRLARNGKCREAMPLYQRAARLDPFHSGAHDGLAYCSYQLGKYDAGISALRIAMRDNPRYHRAWLHKARLERAAGKNIAAVGSFRRYMSGDKPTPDAQFELARALRALKMKDQAITAYGAYLKLENRAYAASQVLAAHLEMKELGGTPPATKITMPGDRGQTVTVSEYIKGRKRQAAAEEKAALPTPVFGKEPTEGKSKAKAPAPPPAVAKDPSPPPMPPPMPPPEKVKAAKVKGKDVSSLALARAVSRDVSDGMHPFPAEAAPAKLYRSAEDTARGLIKLADKEFSRRHMVLALGLYGQAADLDPSNAESLYKGGATAMTLGQMERAVSFYRTLLRINPKDAAARHNLDLARKAARARVVEARQLAASARRVEAMLAARQYDAAEQKATGLLRQLPSSRIYTMRARARLARGDTRGALNDGGRALSLNPNQSAAMRVMGDVHLKEGHKAKAKFYYRLFLARTPAKAKNARQRGEVQKIVLGL